MVGEGSPPYPIHFSYDKNGSLTNKTVEGVSTNVYAYNLANRLSSVTSPGGSTTSYLYDYQGIRVRSEGGGGQHHFLVDHRNPTGYAQVLEEASSQGGAPTRSYVIGDDVLGQCGLSTTDPQSLLYDGHGSTRQLLSDSGSVQARFDYDAYGVSTAALPANPATTLLYSGEQFDPVLKEYYLRARFYNPENGRFNRRDPFSGINHDPQSLHKYAYAHCDPVNMIDPSGMFRGSMISLLAGVAIGASIGAITGLAATKSWKGAAWGALGGASIGAIIVAFKGKPLAKAIVLGFIAGILASTDAYLKGETGQAEKVAFFRGFSVATSLVLANAIVEANFNAILRKLRIPGVDIDPETLVTLAGGALVEIGVAAITGQLWKHPGETMLNVSVNVGISYAALKLGLASPGDVSPDAAEHLQVLYSELWGFTFGRVANAIQVGIREFS